MGLTKRCISYKKYKLYKLDKQPKNFPSAAREGKIPQFLLIVLRGGKAKGERKRCEESKEGFFRVLKGRGQKLEEAFRSGTVAHRDHGAGKKRKNLYFLLGISFSVPPM